MGDKSIQDHVADIKAEGQRCFCDLDKWEPERDTRHAWVCPIHREAKARDLEMKGQHDAARRYREMPR